MVWQPYYLEPRETMPPIPGVKGDLVIEPDDTTPETGAGVRVDFTIEPCDTMPTLFAVAIFAVSLLRNEP